MLVFENIYRIRNTVTYICVLILSHVDLLRAQFIRYENKLYKKNKHKRKKTDILRGKYVVLYKLET